MDQKQSQTLDPKIKEIYERVMNTPTSTKSPEPPPAPLMSAPDQKTPPKSPPPAPSAFASLKKNPSLFVAGAYRPHEELDGDETEEVGKKAGFPKIFFIIGIIVFFAAYAIIWVKFFHLSIPFLPF